MKMNEKILIVEDARMFSRVLKSRLEEKGFKVAVAESMAEADQLLKQDGKPFFLAILDLNLPDAPDGEIVDHVLSFGLPAIVFTAQFSEATRELIIQKNVVDYILKDDPSSIDYVIGLACRLVKNRSVKVLAVDDSITSRNLLAKILRQQQFQVLEASDGIHALEVLHEHQDIQMVLTDYMMPEMDGFELTKAIRRQHSRENLVIIGISAHDRENLSARFMKYGATDFITKPFSAEELQCRVNQNIELVSHIQALKQAVIRDYLTELHNRRFFFDEGEKIFHQTVKDGTPLAVAMLDIDYFKKVNDTYGHDAGDRTLVTLAGLLKLVSADADIIARMGGEEFCILMTGRDQDQLADWFEQLRLRITELAIPHNGQELSITASIGVCSEQFESLDDGVARADELLYLAKKSGRNRVMLG